MDKSFVKKLKKLENIFKIRSPKYRKDALIVFGRKPENYLFLKEITLNLVGGVIELEQLHKKQLRKHYKYMHALLKKKPKTIKEKDRYILQTGGYLPILIPILLKLLTKITDGETT